MSENQFAWTFPGGKLKQEVTSITLVNNTAKTEDVAVPTGKIWKLLGIKILNPDDVNRNITVSIYKEAAKTNIIKTLLYLAAVLAGSASELGWPNAFLSTTAMAGNSHKGIQLLAGGNVISITWAAGGASAGGTDADGLVLEYLEIDAP